MGDWRDELAAAIKGRLLRDEPLAPYTSLRIGGPADAMAFPQDLADLAALLRGAVARGIPVFVLGGGSNTLVRDGGIRGLVINMGEAFRELRAEGPAVTAGASVRISRLLALCARVGLAGLECLTGIPGTVGGAVWGNAGAHGGATADRLAAVRVVTADGRELSLDREAIPFAYRHAGLPPGSVVVEAVFRLEPGDPGEIRRRISKLLVQRNQTQPVEWRSAGCIFKNPEGEYAGRLVDVAGLKGRRVGDAVISERHGNFVVNVGGARAADVLGLVDLMRRGVREASGRDLELEIRVVGEG